MADAIVVLNAGSSSVKFSLFVINGGVLELQLRGLLEGLNTAPHFVAKSPAGATVAEHRWPEGAPLDHDDALDHLVGFLRSGTSAYHLAGVGHRIVHGGPDYAGPVRIDAHVLAKLGKLIPLAPLHQPHNLAPIRRLRERLPDLLQVACFDTSFHRTNPDLAQRYALPERLHEGGVRRYGFHGLSYEYIASALGQLDETAASGKTIALHLGNGASACAIEAGRSVASSMGFTAVEGLVMGTRSGSLDPGVILYLLDQLHMDTRAIEKLVYHESGLLGVSGISSDMRLLLASADPRAHLAVDLFCYRIRREIGSLAAALGGVDAIVFTGGVGENSALIRERVCRDAAWLGVELDPAANAAGGPRISSSESRVSAWSIPTNEELVIARHTQRLLN